MLVLGSFWKTCTPWKKHSRESVLPQVSWDYVNSWKHMQSHDRKRSRTKGPSSEKQWDDHNLQSTSHAGQGIVCISAAELWQRWTRASLCLLIYRNPTGLIPTNWENQRTTCNHHQTTPNNNERCWAYHPTVRCTGQKNYWGEMKGYRWRKIKIMTVECGRREKEYQLDCDFHRHLYTNSSTMPCSQNLWCSLTFKWLALSFPSLSYSEIQPPPESIHLGVLLGISYATNIKVNSPGILSSQLLAASHPASQTCVVPNSKDSFPCACGTIIWAASMVKSCPLLILLP